MSQSLTHSGCWPLDWASRAREGCVRRGPSPPNGVGRWSLLWRLHPLPRRSGVEPSSLSPPLPPKNHPSPMSRLPSQRHYYHCIMCRTSFIIGTHRGINTTDHDAITRAIMLYSPHSYWSPCPTVYILAVSARQRPRMPGQHFPRSPNISEECPACPSP